MAISNGTRLGPYEIVGPLGAGGMGEVYRARDTRLDRSVAIKVLPSHLSAAPDLRERFDREARAVSRFTHPNIATLFDVGYDNSTHFLVMELVEGETLADRLAKGPLPLRELLRYGAEIASALERAHREGIVHRDLKPGNVMLTRSGAKVLDFGLAKVAEAEGVADATVQKPLTGAGTILGTLQYMAPEQLEGKASDARTDIFALGVLLYEMATGKRPFNGASRTSLIASILEQDPPSISQLQPMSPPALERMVRTCLAKDPEERWQTAHDVRLQLQAMSSSEPVAVPRKRRLNLRELVPWLLAIAGVSAAAYYAQRDTRPDAPPMRLSIVPEDGDLLPEFIGVALSPDGRTLAWAAPTKEKDSMLWSRPINALTSMPIAGTEGASHPFWSPDSRFIAFFAQGKLKRVPAGGGAVQRIADAPAGRGGTWNATDDIVFAPTLRGPLHRVSAEGGEATPVTPPVENALGTRRWPWFLPDGRRFLYFGAGGGMTAGIYAGSLDDMAAKEGARSRTQGVYAAPGYLLTVRDGAIVAQGLDLDSLKLRGKPVAVAADVAYSTGFNFADFSISQTGMIAFMQEDPALRQPVWYDRSGRVVGSVGEPGIYLSIRLSPDEGRVLTVRADPETRTGDVWIEEIGRKAAQRVTFRNAISRAVVWSPDGNEVMFGMSTAGPTDVRRKSLTGSSDDEPFFATPSLDLPSDWSPDGIHVLVQQIRDTTLWDLMLARADGKEPVKAWLAGPFDELMARFSPDGKWVAYTSNESGRDEVYVRPFPGPGTATRVSVHGGSMPVWRKDGRELFFLSPRADVMAAPIAAGSPLRFGEPVRLFSASIPEMTTQIHAYDVSRDGQRFLINSRVGVREPKRINVLLNWMTDVE